MPKSKPARLLDDRDRALLTFVREFRAANDYAPSMRAMAEHLRTSTSIINYRIRRLEQRGALHVPRDEYGAMLAHTLKLTAHAYGLLNAREPQTETTHGETTQTTHLAK